MSAVLCCVLDIWVYYEFLFGGLLKVIVLYCIVLYCIVLYCIVLYCIVLYCIVLYCIVLYCIVLYCIVCVSSADVVKPAQEELDRRTDPA